MAGVAAINVAGAGGTSWAGVEKLRAEAVKDDLKRHLGEMFWDWGIPTAASLIEARKAVRIPLIASGGLRNGHEVAKCIALGASIAAMAYPFLRSPAQSLENPLALSDILRAELRNAMVLLCSRSSSATAR